MSQLLQYIATHTECSQLPDGDADVIFFRVKAREGATAEVLRDLVGSHRGEWAQVNLFDGTEHSYLEIGAWLGSQGEALKLMGLGAALGLWQLLTPRTILGKDVPEDLAMQLAGSGLVTVLANKASLQLEAAG